MVCMSAAQAEAIKTLLDIGQVFTITTCIALVVVLGMLWVIR